MTSEAEIALLSRHVRLGTEVKRHLCRARQARIARASEALGRPRSVDGLGRRVASIDAHTYLQWQMAHPGCWEDRAFVREFLRDNEGARVL